MEVIAQAMLCKLEIGVESAEHSWWTRWLYAYISLDTHPIDEVLDTN